MAPEDPELVYSTRSGTYAVDGVVLEVNIVQIEGQAGWTLEVVNEAGTSTTWDALFLTDRLAWNAFERCVEEEGVAAFLDEPMQGRTLH